MEAHSRADPVSSDTQPIRPRIRGVDIARAAAISGMFAVHIGPLEADGVAGRLYALPHGRASILFLLVAGVGVSLLASSRTTSALEARVTLAWRAALLLPLGLALQLGAHGVLVILQDYAVLFVLAILVFGLGDRWLLGLAGASAILGPVIFLWGGIRAPDVFDRGAVAWTDPAREIVHGLLLSGPYPLITWAAPFLFGMWLGRQDLGAPRVHAWLVGAGGTLALATTLVSGGLVALVGEPEGWSRVVVADPHSQMPLWLLNATGSAILVLGVALVAGHHAGRLLWPVVAAGQLALTIYVGHLIALHFARPALSSSDVGEATLLVAAFTLVGVVFATIWRAMFARGPLEALLRLPWRSMK